MTLVAMATGLALATLQGVSPARADVPGDEPGIAAQLGPARLVVGSDCRPASLRRTADGRELLRGGGGPLMALRTATAEVPCTGLRREAGELRARFRDVAAEVRVRWTQTPELPELAVLEIDANTLPAAMTIERVDLFRLPVATDENVGSSLAVRWDGSTTVTLLPGAENVETTATGPAGLVASVHREPGWTPARAGLLVAETARFPELVERAEQAMRLPAPRLDGVWAKRSERARRSYLFYDLTVANVDAAIRAARLAGVDTVLVYASTWAESPGSWRVRTAAYPGGEDALAGVAARLREAGLHLGLHVLTSLVGKRDPLATPRPDPRLLSDGNGTLASALSATATSVPVHGRPEDFPLDDAPYGNARAGRDLRLGDEILRCARRRDAAGGVLLLEGCERGVGGTAASEHADGARIDHLAERYGSYLVDLRSSLAVEVADRLSSLVDRVGADMIYLDAGEVNSANGPAWYWVGRQQTLILERIRRPLLVEGSGLTAWTWHRFTRVACDDPVRLATGAWLDTHKIGRALAASRRSWMPAELGWWGLWAATPGAPGTTPDEAEHLGIRAIAWDAPFSVETRESDLAGNPASLAILATLGRLERIRLAGAVPAATRQQLRSGRWRLDGESPPTFVPREAVAGTSSAGPAEESAELDSGLTLLPSAGGPPVVAAVPSAGDLRAGTLVTAIPVSVDLSRHAALLVTLRVEAGSSPSSPSRPASPAGSPPPVLDVQLEARGRRFRDHLIDLDFIGRRTLRLDRPDAERLLVDVPPDPSAFSVKASLVDFDPARIERLNLRWLRGGIGVRTGEAPLLTIERIVAVAGGSGG